MSSHIVEPRHIKWPDWETRFSGNGPVRSLPLSMASPPPEERKPVLPYFESSRVKRSRLAGPLGKTTAANDARIERAQKKAKEPPACVEGKEHRWVSNGQPAGRYRMKCRNCLHSRLATEQEAEAIRVKQGRGGRPKN